MSGHFSDVMYVAISSFLFIAYLFVVFQIVADLFRNSEMSGGKKALWVIGLIFVPLLTALAYLVIHGRGMADRQRAAVHKAEQYLDEQWGRNSSVDQISRAKSLLDAGTITNDEFLRLKQQALGVRYAHA